MRITRLNIALSRLKLYIAAILCLWSLNGLSQNQILLSGTWQVKLDPQNAGLSGKWYNTNFKETIQLPGTLDDAGIGEATLLSDSAMTKDVLGMLTRKHSYIGPAWYSREVVIPKNWSGKRIQLFLERVIWQTTVWIDGAEVGSDESLSVPHRFELKALSKPGKHRLVIRIDNSKQYDVSVRDMAHAYTDGTQIKWNGIIGKIALQAKENVRIGAVYAYPDAANRSVNIRTVLINQLTKTAEGKVSVQIFRRNGSLAASQKATIHIPEGETKKELQFSLGKDAAFWDEFNRNLYTVKVQLTTPESSAGDKYTTSFGLRSVTGNNGEIQVNGRRAFMRGTLECNIFPLTGYPPMNKQGWLKVFNTAREYGLNHLRFHSWCPPEAAFNVADSLGFYLQIELPFWNSNAGKDAKVNSFLEREARRISDEYGNHPSFCFWSMGNELEGDFNWIDTLLKTLKGYDPRHLYTTTTFSFQKDHGRWPEKADDFFITQYTTKGWVRGQGIFNSYPPDFSTDYSAAVEGLPVPVITHEIGQYSVYPNIDEIKKYTGVLDPLNFKAIRNDLQKKGMLSLARSFMLASGKFSANLYKEEIERSLKTKGMSGFQLLDLHDFPGQGTALVGVLDAFWDSKGLVTAKEHRAYCSPVVPLIRFPKATYINTEMFSADAEIANFSSGALKNMVMTWNVKSSKGQVLFKGDLNKQEIPVGNGLGLGRIEFPLNQVGKAEQLTIELQVKGTEYKNSWRIWVYPHQVDIDEKGIVVTRSFSEAMQNLKEGRTVLLNPDISKIKGVEGRFAPVFWSPLHFPDQPGTMGILCDPAHPALRDFPTDFYCDWQWWDLITSSKSMVIDSVATLNPLVRVIDNFHKNRKMANIIEAKAGKGKLILASADISSDLEKRPAARQLRYSLLRYMNSKDFAPAVELTEKQLEYLIKE